MKRMRVATRKRLHLDPDLDLDMDLILPHLLTVLRKGGVQSCTCPMLEKTDPEPGKMMSAKRRASSQPPVFPRRLRRKKKHLLRPRQSSFLSLFSIHQFQTLPSSTFNCTLHILSASANNQTNLLFKMASQETFYRDQILSNAAVLFPTSFRIVLRTKKLDGRAMFDALLLEGETHKVLLAGIGGVQIHEALFNLLEVTSKEIGVFLQERENKIAEAEGRDPDEKLPKKKI